MRILATLVFLIPTLALSDRLANVQQDYRTYHEQINEAEEFISKEQFQQALNTYDETFDSYDFVFLRDYKIAAQLALFLDDIEATFEIIRKGIVGGWSLKSLKKNSYLSNLKSEAQWELIVESYPELREKYEQSINNATREEVHKMFKKDQNKALGALFRIGDKAQDRYATKKFAPHSEIQLRKLITILEDQGYPGERLIGNNFWMSTILSHHNSITTEYVKNDTLYHDIKPELTKALERGQISPYEFALIDDWYIAVSSDRTQTGYGFLNPPKRSSLDVTETLRQSVGLRSIELRNRLIDIQNETGMNFYLPDWIEGKIEVK